jgi:hypothetical protein
LYSSIELITLPGKSTRGIVIHPIIEIRLVGGQGGGFVQVAPVALVIEHQEGLSTFLMENINKSDVQSVG